MIDKVASTSTDSWWDIKLDTPVKNMRSNESSEFISYSTYDGDISTASDWSCIPIESPNIELFTYTPTDAKFCHNIYCWELQGACEQCGNFDMCEFENKHTK